MARSRHTDMRDAEFRKPIPGDCRPVCPASDTPATNNYLEPLEAACRCGVGGTVCGSVRGGGFTSKAGMPSRVCAC